MIGGRFSLSTFSLGTLLFFLDRRHLELRREDLGESWIGGRNRNRIFTLMGTCRERGWEITLHVHIF